MVFGTKEEQDLYVSQTIKNLVYDEVVFNVSNRAMFVDWHHFKGVFDEEHEEALEALCDYQECIKAIWKLARLDADTEAFKERVKIALEQGYELIHETVHMQAVLLKAYHQLVKEKKYRELEEKYSVKKAPITDQSK